eukprot:Em0008g869a
MQSVTPVITAAAKMIAVMEVMLATNAESEPCCTVIKVVPSDPETFGVGVVALDPDISGAVHAANGELYYRLGERDVVRYIQNLKERHKIALACHVHPTSGHNGVKKTIARVKERCTWKGVVEDVKKIAGAISELKNHRLMMLEKVIQNISTAQGKQKQMYERKHAIPCEFQVRTLVVRKDSRRKKRKGGKWMLNGLVHFFYQVNLGELSESVLPQPSSLKQLTSSASHKQPIAADACDVKTRIDSALTSREYRAVLSDQLLSTHLMHVSKKKISSAIGLGREGLLGKACQALVSPGIAPNTQEVWNSLQQKHPKGAQPSLPTSSSPPVTHVLPQDFNILSVLHSFPKGTACGPSGLRIQHVLDSAQIHLSVPLCSSLRGVVDILASGRAPISVSKFLAGGSLTALVKNKEGRPLDIRPIAVGEALRRLTGKCLCIITKPKATDFFAPLQYGVACTAGAEKVIHGVRSCIKEHWIDDNFTVCKVDMSNAFNCVSRQALLEECAVHFPELLPWVGWCYGSQPTLWHPLGQLSSEVGVQQGDPLGPLLFSLVLHKVVSYIAQDRECLPLLFNGWYLDDGVLLGHSQAVNRALTLIQKMGQDVSKCELFGCGDLSSFPPEMKVSRVPNLVILGAPIGDLIFCAKFVVQKRADAAVLLSQLAEVGAEDPQVAFLLLRQCAAFCKLVHLARSAPPSHIAEGLALFDKDVRQCFAECTAVDAADVEWMQAQLSLSRGGLGLRSLSSHCVAAYLASISSSGCDKWNLLVEPIELFNGARLLSISSRHAASWLTVVPSPGLNLHLEPNEFQIAVKWWLGMDVSFGSCCPHCPDHRLDPLGHHALMCKHGGDVVLRHNSLRDVFVEFCHRACLGGQVEVGSGQGHDRLNSRPADVLVKNWHLGKPAAFDLTITSPLNPTTLTEAGVKCGSSAQVAEVRKHAANDGKCKELGWVCIPLAVESYGCWGMEAQESFKRLAARLAIQMGCSRSQATTTLYQRLSLSLVRANARALLSRARVHLEEGG